MNRPTPDRDSLRITVGGYSLIFPSVTIDVIHAQLGISPTYGARSYRYSIFSGSIKIWVRDVAEPPSRGRIFPPMKPILVKAVILYFSLDVSRSMRIPIFAIYLVVFIAYGEVRGLTLTVFSRSAHGSYLLDTPF